MRSRRAAEKDRPMKSTPAGGTSGDAAGPKVLVHFLPLQADPLTRSRIGTPPLAFPLPVPGWRLL